MRDQTKRGPWSMEGLLFQGIDPQVAAIACDEVGRCKVGGPMPITFDLARFSSQCIVVVRTTDRDDPGRHIEFSQGGDLAGWLRFRMGISDGQEASIRAAVQEFLFNMARDAYLHELAEWFTRDGVRVRDPHANGEP